MQNVNLLNMTTAEKLVALAKAVNDIYDTLIIPNPRGVWASNESYNKYDTVVYNNKTYWSIYDGAQSGQQPDTSPNYWAIYIDPQQGVKGKDGTDGKAATIQIGSTETVEPDQPAEVINVGSANAAIFNFKIPKGESALKVYLHTVTIKDETSTGGCYLSTTFITVNKYSSAMTIQDIYDFIGAEGQLTVSGIFESTAGLTYATYLFHYDEDVVGISGTRYTDHGRGEITLPFYTTKTIEDRVITLL